MITYNKNDEMFYGTNSERLAAPMGKFAPNDKFYEYDTSNIYTTDGSTWKNKDINYQDLGLVIDATNMAAGATVYGSLISGLEWVRNFIMLYTSDQNFDIMIKRQDTAGNISGGSTLKSAAVGDSSRYALPFSLANVSVASSLIGYAATFGIKNVSASPNTFAKLWIQLMGS